MQALATVILLMVAPSASDNHLENYSEPFSEAPSMASCRTLADHKNKTSEFHWWCLEAFDGNE